MLAAATPSNDDIRPFLPMVRRVVRSMGERLPDTVDMDGLESAGLLGLLHAFAGYDADKGVPFETYAKIRVRGAVRDELRGLDHLTRRQRRRVKGVEATREALERNGGFADEATIADSMNLTVNQVSSAFHLPSTPQSMDPAILPEVALASPWQEPLNVEASYLEKERRALLVDALGRLPEREQTIMSLYYKEELTLAEIGELVGVSQSRVSQILSKVRKQLARKLADS